MQMRRMAFTLTELLVALTISSIIMLAVVGSFGLGLRIWRKVENRRPIDETGRRILAVLQRELAGVYLPPSPEGVETTFQAEGPHKLSFFTANPGYYHGRPFGLCARVIYEFKEGVLTRSEELAATEKPIAGPTTEVLAEGLSNVAFAYVQDPALPAAGGGASADNSRPPKLVQVTLEWPGASAFGQFLVPVREPLATDQE